MSQQHPDDIISKFTRIFYRLDIINTKKEDELWHYLVIYVYDKKDK